MRTCTIVMLLALAAVPARAWVAIGSHCEGDTISIGVGISHAAAWGVANLNVKWALADSPTQQSFVLEEPIAVAATDDEQHFSIRVAAPFSGRLLIYSTYFTNADGEQVAGSDYGCSWFASYAICGELFLFRGRIFDFGHGLTFTYCDPFFDGCGGFNLDIHGVSDWQSYVDTGRLVNAYGTPGWFSSPPCAEPGSGCATVTRLEFENDPAGCAALAIETTTWGTLKSVFR